MANKINQTNDVVTAILTGDQSYDDIVAIGSELQKLAVNGSLSKLYLDISKVKKVDVMARQEAGRLAKRFRYERVAVVGTNTFNNALVTLIARTSKRVGDLRTFDNKKEAIKWLNG